LELRVMDILLVFSMWSLGLRVKDEGLRVEGVG
jgi:hypothetical protein